MTNKFPAGTNVVIYDNAGVVQTVGSVYGWGEDLHREDQDYDPAYWQDVVLLSPDFGYLINEQIMIDAVSTVPDDISPYRKWCYAPDQGFYPNPNYKEPEVPNNDYGVSNETYNAIIDDYTLSLMDSGVL